MEQPARSAAAVIISPFWATTSLPSRMIVTVSVVASSAMWTPSILDVHEELVAEHADARHDRAWDRRAERADRCLPRRPRQAGRDVVTDVGEQVDVGLAPLSLLDAQQDLLEPATALATRRALPARLAVKELGQPVGRPDHARGVIHGDDGPRTEHGAEVAL